MRVAAAQWNYLPFQSSAQFNIDGFPTIKVLMDDGVVDYEGGNDARSIGNYRH